MELHKCGLFPLRTRAFIYIHSPVKSEDNFRKQFTLNLRKMLYKSLLFERRPGCFIHRIMKIIQLFEFDGNPIWFMLLSRKALMKLLTYAFCTEYQESYWQGPSLNGIIVSLKMTTQTMVH